MENFSEKACNNFKNGYNCAQSVLLAFASQIGLTDDIALRLASSFGGGMGRLREVCGAVSAMFMIAGILKGYTSPNNDTVKSEHYKLIQELGESFKTKCGSIICREILNLDELTSSPIPSKRTKQYYEERPCENCIKVAADLIEDILLNKNADKHLSLRNN